MRTPLFAGNWKMFKTVHEAVAFAKEFKAAVKDVAGVDIVLAPPFTAVHAVAEHQMPRPHLRGWDAGDEPARDRHPE